MAILAKNDPRLFRHGFFALSSVLNGVFISVQLQFQPRAILRTLFSSTMEKRNEEKMCKIINEIEWNLKNVSQLFSDKLDA